LSTKDFEFIQTVGLERPWHIAM